jgi:hypothetical protein
VQHSRESRLTRHYDERINLYEGREDFSGEATWSGAYLQTRWSSGRFTLIPGARFDHWGLTHREAVSPWLQAEWKASGPLRVRLSSALYHQSPAFENVIGLRAGPHLLPERASHFDLSLEGHVTRQFRWEVTFYDREDRDLLRLPDSEIRLGEGRVHLPSLTSHYVNALDGYSRGAELVLERKSPNGLSGWMSYALGFNRYRDRLTDEEFWGDFDQRHTVNLYGSYRLSTHTSVSAKFRGGSNYPIVGYWEGRQLALGMPPLGAPSADEPPFGDFLSSARNRLRLPFYSRLDLRLSRVFNWRRSRMTAFAEVTNALNRENQRVGSPSVDGRTGRVTNLTEALFPILPSVGVLLEF